VVTTDGKSSKFTITDDVAADETQAEDEDKEEEIKIDKKLKLNVGLPSNRPFEVKVMVYVIRVRWQHFYSLFSDSAFLETERRQYACLIP